VRYLAYSLLSLLIAFLLFGVFISRYDLQLRTSLTVNNHPGFFDYRGITHTMTNYSQGSAGPAEMFENASKAGVDFLYVTDHNDFDPSHEIFGYNDDVLVLTGKKVSYLDSHFLLYSQTSMKKIDSLGAAQALLVDLLNRVPTDAEDVTVIMAHPFKLGHEWTPPFPEGMDGLEVMNLNQMWQRAWITKKASFIWSLLLYVFNPKIALVRLIYEPRQELDLWDKLSQKHKMLGVLGNHSTGKIFALGPLSLSFPTYEDSFRFASNHVLLKSELTGVASRDIEKIHGAFTRGNFYFAIDALANPQGFAAYMTSNGHDISMGETVKMAPDLNLTVDLPKLNVNTYQVKVYRDGKELLVSKDQNSKWPIKQPGVYRVYVRVRLQLPIPGDLRWVPWIYTNNFYVQ